MFSIKLISLKMKHYIKRFSSDFGILPYSLTKTAFLMQHVRSKSEFTRLKYNYSTFGLRGTQEPVLNHRPINVVFQNQRYFSSSELPKLTEDFMQGPNLLAPIKNAIIVYFTIKPLLDRDFRIDSFKTASEKALSVVSNKLAQNNIEELESLMTSDMYREIQKNFPLFSEEQRQKLALNLDDIVMSVVADIQVESRRPEERTLHIITVHQFVKNYKQLLERLNSFSPSDYSQGRRPEFPTNFELLGGFMRLSRNFNIQNKTADDWIISGLNFVCKKVSDGFFRSFG